MTRGRKLLAFVVTAVLATAGVAAAAALGPERSLSGSTTYTADLGGLGSITIPKVVVSNDDSGNVTISGWVENRPTFLTTMGARVWFEPSENTPPNRPDIMFSTSGLEEYDATGTLGPAPADIRASYADGVVTFTVARSELPGTSFFFELGVWDNAEPVPGSRFVAQDEVSGSYRLQLGVTTARSTTAAAKPATTVAKPKPKLKPKPKPKPKPKKPKPKKK